MGARNLEMPSCFLFKIITKSSCSEIVETILELEENIESYLITSHIDLGGNSKVSRGAKFVD